MNCDDCRDLILDLLYEELPPARRREAEAHLASCPDCRRELTELKSTVAAVRRLPDPEPPPFLDTKVKARAREAGEAFVSSFERLPGASRPGFTGPGGSRRRTAAADRVER